MDVLHEIGKALYMAFVMLWEILWALCLGFFISGVVQAVVSKRQVAKILGDDRPKTIATACGLGAASSSCSYAALDPVHVPVPICELLEDGRSVRFQVIRPEFLCNDGFDSPQGRQ